MYDPPAYLWAITIAGIIAIPAAACVVLYGGAERAGLGRTRAALLAGGAAVVLGGWFTASAALAGTARTTRGSATGYRGCRSRWPASSARCWRCAGSRRWRAPWRRRAW